MMRDHLRRNAGVGSLARYRDLGFEVDDPETQWRVDEVTLPMIEMEP